MRLCCERLVDWHLSRAFQIPWAGIGYWERARDTQDVNFHIPEQVIICAIVFLVPSFPMLNCPRQVCRDILFDK